MNEYSEDETFRIPVTRCLIAAVYCSQLPGVVYLQVPSMTSQNIKLAMYLRWIGGFIYHHQPMIIVPALTDSEKRSWFLASGIRADVPFGGNVLSIEQPIHDVVSMEDRYLLSRDAFYKRDGMQQQHLEEGGMFATSEMAYPVTIADCPDLPFMHGAWVRLTSSDPLYVGDIGFVFCYPKHEDDWHRHVLFVP